MSAVTAESVQAFALKHGSALTALESLVQTLVTTDCSHSVAVLQIAKRTVELLAKPDLCDPTSPILESAAFVQAACVREHAGTPLDPSYSTADSEVSRAAAFLLAGRAFTFEDGRVESVDRTEDAYDLSASLYTRGGSFSVLDSTEECLRKGSGSISPLASASGRIRRHKVRVGPTAPAVGSQPAYTKESLKADMLTSSAADAQAYSMWSTMLSHLCAANCEEDHEHKHDQKNLPDASANAVAAPPAP